MKVATPRVPKKDYVNYATTPGITKKTVSATSLYHMRIKIKVSYNVAFIKILLFLYRSKINTSFATF